MDSKLIVIGLVQAVLIMMIAPLLDGISRRMRARVQNRRGAGIFQTYYDIFKLFHREQTLPPQAGFIFTATPYILIGSLLLVAMIIPAITQASPLGLAGDLFTVLYLMALVRFFFSLSGLESASPFAAAGSSREMMLSVLVEPGMVLVLVTMALLTGSTNLGDIATGVASGEISYLNAALLVGMIAFMICSYIETGKIPFDLAEAEQELQEGPLAEYSGRGLALMKWSLLIKQVVVVALFLALFVPFGSAADLAAGSLLAGMLVFAAKLVLVFIIMALVENTAARYRITDVAPVTSLSIGLATMSFVFYLVVK